MDMSFIVRRAEELDIPGAEILKESISLERVDRALGEAGERDRIYNPVTTWLIFLGETLSVDHSCRNAVAQARASGLLPKKSSVHTGAYCQARDRLDENALRKLATQLGNALMEKETPEERWHGRRVVVPDGSSVSLPDTPANQAVYPQSSRQAAGCGFPIMYLCGLMSLASGAFLDFEPGAGNGNELTLWRKLWPYLRDGDIVLGDGKYGSYADLAVLRNKGIDVVSRPGNRKVNFGKGNFVCTGDHVVKWKRPQKLPAWLGEHVLPETMLVREIRFRVEIPGFRPETITVVTTLLDGNLYPQEEIADLFFRRWQVELRLRDIKTLLGMDQLRTKTPKRARKELWMFLTAFNLLRSVMQSASRKTASPVTRVSFQGTRQRILAMATRKGSAKQFCRAYKRLIHDIAWDLNPYRPFRIEPRAIKRRKKQYDFLNQPRSVLREKLKRTA